MKLRRNKMKEKRHESSQYAIVSEIVESYLRTRREQYIRQVSTTKRHPKENNINT